MTTGSDNALLSRIPPQNLEAEQAALGAMLLDYEMFQQGMHLLRETDFYREAHRVIYRAMTILEKKREPIDLLLLANHLEAAGKLEEVGGTLYLQTVMAQTPTHAGLPYYAQVIKDCSRRREAIKAADALITKAYQRDEEFLPSLDGTRAALDAIRETGTIRKATALREFVKDVFYQLEDELTSEVVPGLRTNLDSLNKCVTFNPGDLVLICGRPSMGKSAGALQVALSIMERGIREKTPKHGLFYTLEMSEHSLARRALQYQSRVSGSLLKNLEERRRSWDEIAPRLGHAVQDLWEYDLDIIKPSSLTPSDILAAGRSKKRTHGLDFIVVDYVQLMDGDGKHENRREEVGSISKNLKRLAGELHVPVFAVAQLSRECEKRTPRRPMMSDLRETGQLEQDADIIIMTYRPGYYGWDEYQHKSIPRNLIPDEEFTALTHLIVAKNRDGEPGDCWVRFDMDVQRLHDIESRYGNGDEPGGYQP